MSDRALRRGFADPNVRALFDAALAQGWTYRITGGTHVLMTPPQGGTSVALSTTAKEGRAYYNTRSAMRRLGLDA